MTDLEKKALKIIYYPDPRLKKKSDAVTAFDADLRGLVSRMFELMRESKGVGLAAPQVGRNVRLFVANPTGQPEDDKVYVNPVLSDLGGSEESEEGCLSIPNISVKVNRATTAMIKAQDLDGNPFEQDATGFVTRVWQHEFDHINGILITDRMGPVAKLANRKLLKELEEKYNEEKYKGQ